MQALSLYMLLRAPPPLLLRRAALTPAHARVSMSMLFSRLAAWLVETAASDGRMLTPTSPLGPFLATLPPVMLLTVS